MIEIVDKNDSNRREQRLKALLARGVSFDGELMAQVGAILDDVRQRGDAALIAYTARFDGVELDPEELRVSEETLQHSAARADPKFLEALRRAIHNVREFHQQQLETSWEMTAPGILLGQRVTPIESVGLYVPGGTAAYPSSVVMNVVPAQIAGVERIAVTTPPQTLKDNPAVAAALKELGVTEVYRIGGAQAIAALTYGTHSIRQVDKITGPGNRFVAAAKKLVFGLVGIDSIAGPTEVVIIADESARPEFIAADLLAQAEHAVDAAVVLITTNLSLAEAVVREIGRQIRSLARADLIRTSIEKYGLILITHTIDEAYELVNRIAPEHVQIMTDAADEDAKKVRHAGAIFIGAQTPAAVGDYFAGPNHVLPTGGSARFSSALSVKDFLKRTSLVRYSADALREAAESIAALATVERLDAHAQSALIRLNHRQS